MMEIFSFELKYRLKRPVTWIYMALGMTIALLISIFQRSATAELVNSPSSIAGITSGLSVISIFFYAAIMGVPIFRDQDHKTAQTYFTFPIPEKSYVLGRFLGSYMIVTLVNLSILFGIILGFGIGAFWDRPDYGMGLISLRISYLLSFYYKLTPY